ncbi:MAG: SAM hydrolase/SAM-dependent halogenase family protein [Candidatus Caldatribacteriaceae bacterium]
MRLIALLTDWGTKSYYQGVVKGVIKKIAPKAEIVDLTHEVEPFNVREAMHMLFRAYRDFPEGTIFCCVVDYGVGTERKAIALETKSGYFFVGPDNGLFTLVIEKEIVQEVVELKNPRYFYCPIPSSSFHGRDIFAPVSAHIARGVSLREFGERIESLTSLPYEKARKEGGTVSGEVAYFDRFGNIETNISRIFLEGLKLYNEVTIYIEEKEFKATYCRTYGDVPKGALLIHADSSGFLEIAVNQGNAREEFSLQGGEKVCISFGGEL